ncbi:MAG: NPCBM/NEW2 domain-containing protein [Oscillospiraceae bacterium]|jgi:hypothetical protein|nr:NPCBM/NEW2 domain-containing protein [Oscillospiraceae bacterium]
MLKQAKGFVAGIVVGLILAVSVGAAFAATTERTLTAYFNDIKIVVDGKLITPKDARGNILEPFIANDSTYLPLRAVADALGKSVQWVGETNTVYLGKMDGMLAEPSVYLGDAPKVNSDIINAKRNVFDNFDGFHDIAYSTDYGDSHKWEYQVNARYSRFKGTVFVERGEIHEGVSKFYIIIDGKVAYTSPDITKASNVISFDVDISGGSNIKIVVEQGYDVYSDSGPRLLFDGNSGFYQ